MVSTIRIYWGEEDAPPEVRAAWAQEARASAALYWALFESLGAEFGRPVDEARMKDNLAVLRAAKLSQ